MKTNPVASRLARHQRGMALISVLAVLFLLTLLVVAFMARTTGARAAATNFRATASARALSDTAINLVQAQINEATTAGINSGTATYTWGSQPGAIRVFDQNGALKSIYRLYSATPSAASSARIATAVTALTSDLPAAATWTTYGAQWCDLNSFALDSSGRYHFPVVDPRDTGADPTANPTTVATLWQPSSGALALSGFSIHAPGTVGNSTNPAPMPVRWLYILKDGSIVSPDSPSTASNQLTFNGAVDATGAADVPSLKNPIVGRIAFWTDDESSKININTAAGDDVVRGGNAFAANSIFWATPAFSAADEDFLANYQPVNGEIQRYPGNPGTVGLNTTLSTLAGLTTPLAYTDFYSLIPRFTAGGSTSSTIVVPTTDNNGKANVVPLSGSRLYTSVGEMLYKVDRTESKLIQGAPTPSIAQEKEAAAAVERSDFFLTAHSSSSELNLYGEPRVSIWPVNDKTPVNTYQTPIDQLLCFDSTIPRTASGNANQFYFQREDSTNTNTDCNIANNKALFNYLDNLTALTGSGAPTGIPGFGGKFTTNKYPNTQIPPATRQIIAEIFDYIRTINVLDPVMFANTPSGSPSLTYGQNWGDPNSSVKSTGNRTGFGGVQVVPSANIPVNTLPNLSKPFGVNKWGCQGLAAFPIPVEITVDFAALGLGQQPAMPPLFPLQGEVPIPQGQYQYPYLAHDQVTTGYDNIFDDVPPNPKPSGYPTIYYTTPPSGRPADGSTAMQAFVYVSFVNPAEITARIQPAFSYSLTGLNQLSVTGYASGNTSNTIYMHFPGSTKNTAYGSGSAGGFGDEEFNVIDNGYGGGYQNGWVGDWVFGYIPFAGETGFNNYGGSCAVLGATQTQWGLSSPAGSTVRSFPFYSQIFAVPGQQGWTTAHGNPSNNTFTTSSGTYTGSAFQFDGSNSGAITLTMYDTNHDNQTFVSSHKVATYQFTFPSSGPILTPTLSTADSQMIGTQGNTGAWSSDANSGRVTSDRWHYDLASDSGNSYYSRHMTLNDTVQSLELSSTWSDVRVLAMSQVTAAGAYTKHPNYGMAVVFGNSTHSQAHDQLVDCSEPFVGNLDPTNWGRLVTQSVGSDPSYAPSTTDGLSRTGFNYPIVPPRLTGPSGQGNAGEGAYTLTSLNALTSGAPGDWDNGIGGKPDGPWINMADEGALVDHLQQGGQSNSVAYYSTGNLAQNVGISSMFSPNREIPSPVMFGSLPTGVNSTNPQPWQTLLFRPGPGAGGFGKYHWGEKDQPQTGDPADHLLLDLFWMPQAEPYPISSPFETQGKINLNYEIQPFTYITRNTALRALLGSEEIAVMPDALSASYKVNGNPLTVASNTIADATSGMDANGNTRLPIDTDQTLGLNPDPTADPHNPTTGTDTTDSGQTGTTAWYDSSAKTTRFFRSATELCEMFLVPKGYDWNEFSGVTFDSHSWYMIPSGDFALVGDNTREKPYADLYPRVTTKSNTYTVYYTVQSLKNAEPQTDAGQKIWDESKGNVVGEYRAATTLERYLDPNEKLPDFLGNPTTFNSLEPYYKWRVLGTKQFAP